MTDMTKAGAVRSCPGREGKETMTAVKKHKMSRADRERVRTLRGCRKDLLSGGAYWGLPICDGRHPEPVIEHAVTLDGHLVQVGCEGCAGKAFIKEKVSDVDAQIRALTDPPEAVPVLTGVVIARPAKQDTLW